MISTFNCAFTYLGDNENFRRVAIITDIEWEKVGGEASIIDALSKKLFVDTIIYLDPDKVWWFWSREFGFKSLLVAVEDTGRMMPPPTLEVAIAVSKNRYINKRRVGQ